MEVSKVLLRDKNILDLLDKKISPKGSFMSFQNKRQSGERERERRRREEMLRRRKLAHSPRKKTTEAELLQRRASLATKVTPQMKEQQESKEKRVKAKGEKENIPEHERVDL